jgi:hypothetical protein
LLSSCSTAGAMPLALLALIILKIGSHFCRSQPGPLFSPSHSYWNGRHAPSYPVYFFFCWKTFVFCCELLCPGLPDTAVLLISAAWAAWMIVYS